MDADSERLLRGFVEGELSEDEARVLLERLAADPALLDQAAAQWRVDRMLETAGNQESSDDALVRSVRAALEGSKVSEDLSRKVAMRLRGRRRARTSRPGNALPWIIAGAAAAVLVIALVALQSRPANGHRPPERLVQQPVPPEPEPPPPRPPEQPKAPLPKPPPEPPRENPPPPPPAPPPAPREPGKPPPPKPTVAAVARLENARGVQVNGAPARPGQDLLAGQPVETGPDGAAALVLGDGTRIELLAATRVSVDGRIVLAAGRLSADVTPRPAGPPLVFETPHAEATVLGTKLLLAAEGADTRLEVAEGRVRIERRDDRAAVVVAADRVAVVSKGVPLEARPRAAVVSFTLINADTNLPVPGFDPIKDGAALNLSRLPTRRLNIRANTSGTVGCVQFGFDGNVAINTEREAPYGLATSGEKGDPFSAWTPAAGAHTLTATPWSGPPAPQKRGGTGLPGRALTIRFTVVER